MTTTQFDTVSEAYFAAYLDEAKLCWDRHPQILGQSNIPDFGFDHSGVRVLCDVKERTPTKSQLAEFQLARHFDPIKQVRHLLKKGREKFRGFDGQLCALIIYNNGHRDTRLDPYCVFGAMLGNPGFRANLNVQTGVVDLGSIQSGFLHRGGAMIHKYDPLILSKSLRNISAVVALEAYRISNPLFEQARDDMVCRRTAQLGRRLSTVELVEILTTLIDERGMRASLGDAWGLTVCINPFAKIPFPGDLFDGAFDARWTMVDGALTRVFVGKQRAALDQSDDGDIEI